MKTAINTEQERTTEKKKLFVETFMSTLANISVCCKKIGVSRQTFYSWRNTDKAFAEEIFNAQEELIDFAETILFKKVRDGSTAELIFFLKTKGKARGYYERQEITTDQKAPLFEVKIIDNVLDITPIEEKNNTLEQSI